MRFSSATALFASVLVSSVAATPVPPHFHVGIEKFAPTGESVNTGSSDNDGPVILPRSDDIASISPLPIVIPALSLDGAHAPGPAVPSDNGNGTAASIVTGVHGLVGNQAFSPVSKGPIDRLLSRRDNGTSLADTFSGPIGDMTDALSSSQLDLTKVALAFGAMQQVVNNTDSADDPQLKDSFSSLVDQINQFAGDTAKMMQALSDIKDGLNNVKPGLGDVNGSSDDSNPDNNNSKDDSKDSSNDDSNDNNDDDKNDDNSDVFPF